MSVERRNPEVNKLGEKRPVGIKEIEFNQEKANGVGWVAIGNLLPAEPMELDNLVEIIIGK